MASSIWLISVTLEWSAMGASRSPWANWVINWVVCCKGRVIIIVITDPKMTMAKVPNVKATVIRCPVSEAVSALAVLASSALRFETLRRACKLGVSLS